jgi:hypothetical protein
MKRIVCEWSGAPITGLAVTVLHFEDAVTSPATNALTFFTDVRSVLPSNVTVTVPESGDVIDPTNGQLIDVWGATGDGGAIAGSGLAISAAGVGACITWLTDGITAGHRVRGRTFLVPMTTDLYDADGTLHSLAVTALNAGAGNLVTGGLSVWHRPSGPGLSDGSEHPANNWRVRDKVAYLSSRRD